MSSQRQNQQQQHRRRQLLTGSATTVTQRSNEHAPPSQPSENIPKGSLQDKYPSDTVTAIYCLLDLLQPQRIKQQKAFPKVCMIHQIYGIVPDHTNVDRTLAQLIKDRQIKKLYLGGTGSDEFAIMLMTDYIDQIQQAKEQYLKDLQDSIDTSSAAVAMKRKQSPTDSSSSSLSPMRTKRVASNTRSNGSAPSAIGHEPLSAVKYSAEPPAPSAPLNRVDPIEGALFDRFRDLVTGGNCIEISIQHTSLRQAIGATEEDITTLIRYSLLNRSLSVPANPHLVNLAQPLPSNSGGGNSTTATTNGSSFSSSSSHHSALNQLISATNQEQAKSFAASTSSSSTSTTPAAGLPLSSSSSTPTNVPASMVTRSAMEAASSRGEQLSDDVAYRFAVRQGGLFVTHFLKGRQEILRMIKRQMFKDMLTSAVVAKPLRGSFLPHAFHIHDLVGSGRVQSIQTTSGQLLKLTEKGEASAKAG